MNKIRAIICAGLTLLVMVISALTPVLGSRQALAAETGEYPWADAIAINTNTYDWGYADCKTSVQQAGLCGVTLSKQGQRYHNSDPWRYALRNCTSYVAWRIDKEFGISVPGWGNAHNWDNSAARAGYAIDDSPRVGDIAVWEGYYGHVAFVTSVNPDGSVNIDQYNKQGTGEFSRESRVRANKYIHVASETQVASLIEALNPQEKAQQTASAPGSADAPQNPGAEVKAGEKAKESEIVESAPAQIPATRNTQLVPKPSLGGSELLPGTDTYQYDIIKDPGAGEVVVYAIQFNETKTGKVELSVSNHKDGNSTWRETWAVDHLTHAKGQTVYKMSDYNADGKLDLYQIKFNGTSTDKTEVRVYDGAKAYGEEIGAWKTSQEVHTAGRKVEYGVADHDGDGVLDIYRLSVDADLKQNLVVMDGKSGFDNILASVVMQDAAQGELAMELSDNDRDGRVDMIHTYARKDHAPTVYIYSGHDKYATKNTEYLLYDSLQDDHPLPV